MRKMAGTLILVSVLLGCDPGETRIVLTSYDQEQVPHRYAGEFEQAYYRRMPGGKYELVLHSEKPSSLDPTQTITQVLYVRLFWQPRPGTTAVEATQINAKVQYAVLTPPTGVRYDGAGFVTCKVTRATGELVGRIESGTLLPRYRMGPAAEPFDSARIEGTFRAVESPARVLRDIQLIETRVHDKLPATTRPAR